MRRFRGWSWWVAGALLLVVAAEPASAQTATALLREGDPIPGHGNVSALSTSMVNHVGGYAVTMNTLDAGNTVSHIWGDAAGGPGSLLLSEGTYAGYEQTSFEAFAGLSDAGEAAYSPIVNRLPSGPNNLDSVWVDATPVLIAQNAVPSLPGQFSTFGSRAAMTADGVPTWVGGISNIQGGATQNRVLFYGYGATPLFAGGDAVGGVAETAQLNTGAVDFNYRFSEFGTHWIMEVLLDTGSSANDGVVVVDGIAGTAGGGLLREGTTVAPAAGGLPGEAWSVFDQFGIEEDGTFFMTGNTNATSSSDEFVLFDGQIVLREGTVLATDSGDVTVSGAIESAYMNEQGDWAASWDVDLDGGTNVEALIYNGQVVLREGDAVDLDGDGVVEPSSILSDFTGIASLTVGDRGPSGSVAIYFTADVDTAGTPSTSDDTEALFRLVIAPPNQPPVALCADRTVTAGESCTAEADVDDGSFDPDGDPITLEQAPPGPYGLGDTEVTLTVTDDSDRSDSCMAVVTVIPEPLRLEVSPDELSWGPAVCDVGFDVVRGDVSALVSSGGDYSVATAECVADDVVGTSIPYAAVPAGEGEGYWFLARRLGPAGPGSYDSGGESQQGSRDAGINASASSCP